MSEEDHRLKRLATEDECNVVKAEKEKVVEHAEKARKFKWDDVEDEEIEEILAVSDEAITECSSTLADHLLSTISGEHFSGSDISGMKFVIPIDPGIHILLKNRFEEKWSLDSRLDMFTDVREHLASEFSEDTEKRATLDAKIQEALPPTHRKKLILTDVELVDDAMVVDDESNMVSIEVPLSFAANN